MLSTDVSVTVSRRLSRTPCQQVAMVKVEARKISTPIFHPTVGMALSQDRPTTFHLLIARARILQAVETVAEAGSDLRPQTYRTGALA